VVGADSLVVVEVAGVPAASATSPPPDAHPATAAAIAIPETTIRIFFTRTQWQVGEVGQVLRDLSAGLVPEHEATG
jgi:hypothetical protein